MIDKIEAGDFAWRTIYSCKTLLLWALNTLAWILFYFFFSRRCGIREVQRRGWKRGSVKLIRMLQVTRWFSNNWSRFTMSQGWEKVSLNCFAFSSHENPVNSYCFFHNLLINGIEHSSPRMAIIDRLHRALGRLRPQNAEEQFYE